MAYQNTRSLLRQQGLAPKKRLGQNFLVHRHTAQRIVDLAGIEPDNTVIEVGVGLGALTVLLAHASRRVIGLEADAGIIRLHEEENDLPANVELRHQDVLKTDFGALARDTGARLRIVANLPYSISSPFLFRLMERFDCVQSAVVMLQKEVAQRLLADVGTKEYGAPTVLLQSCATVTPLLLVRPEEFHPRPKVDSMVIRLEFHPVPARVKALEPFDRSLLKQVVNAGFQQRRKTLRNALGGGALPRGQELTEAIVAAGIDPTIRAERLTLEDFVRLTGAIADRLPPTATPQDRQ